jgi:hypothetical protein
MFNYGYYHI